jgi:hypothetical protein
MVAGVIASRVFPAEPLNHRSLATARRPMKRSEIGTLTIMVRRVPVIPVDARDAVNHGRIGTIVRPGIRRRGDAWTPGREDGPRRPPASSHGAGPGKSFDERVYFYARPTHYEY